MRLPSRPRGVLVCRVCEALVKRSQPAPEPAHGQQSLLACLVAPTKIRAAVGAVLAALASRSALAAANGEVLPVPASVQPPQAA